MSNANTFMNVTFNNFYVYVYIFILQFLVLSINKKCEMSICMIRKYLYDVMCEMSRKKKECL